MMPMKHNLTHRPRLALGMLFAFAMGAVACTSHNVKLEPIEFKPIHLTVDINLKVQRELNDFFDFEESADAALGGGLEIPNDPTSGDTTSGDTNDNGV